MERKNELKNKNINLTRSGYFGKRVERERLDYSIKDHISFILYNDDNINMNRFKERESNSKKIRNIISKQKFFKEVDNFCIRCGEVLLLNSKESLCNSCESLLQKKDFNGIRDIFILKLKNR